MLGLRVVDASIKASVKFLADHGEILDDPSKYQRLMGKLNYLTITRSAIAFVVTVVSQFLSTPRSTYWNVVVRILRYLKKTSGKRLLYFYSGHTRVVGFSDTD